MDIDVVTIGIYGNYYRSSSKVVARKNKKKIVEIYFSWSTECDACDIVWLLLLSF